MLRSTSSRRFIDHSLLPSSKPLAVIRNGNSQPQTQNLKAPSVNKNNRQGHLAQEKDDGKCNNEVDLKVYMYDLPPEFHFGLLGWVPRKGSSVWPDIRTEIPSYPGGLNLQHSIEYWLTLDILASEYPYRPNPCSVKRVRNSSEADLIFVPFFASLSYNKFARKNLFEKTNQNRVLQEKLVSFVKTQEEWKRSGGKDHIVVAHHPNSLVDARMQLWPAIYILSDFGRYPPSVANVEKDVIAPYKHMIKTYIHDKSDFDSRPTLLFFQGAIYRKDVSALQFRFGLVECYS